MFTLKTAWKFIRFDKAKSIGVVVGTMIGITSGAANFQNGESGAITLIGVDIDTLNLVLDSKKSIAGKPADLESEGAVSGEYYGTLKAIGASNKFINQHILTQAVIFTITGFVVAYFLLLGFQKGVANSGLIFQFSPLLLIAIFSIIGFIFFSGASFALPKIKGVEAASVFR